MGNVLGVSYCRHQENDSIKKEWKILQEITATTVAMPYSRLPTTLKQIYKI